MFSNKYDVSNKINEGTDARSVEFWVVTTASGRSTLQDICYKTNPISFAREFMGGLKESQVVKIFPADEESEATKLGQSLIKKQKIEQ